jgi:hypothetical protein
MTAAHGPVRGAKPHLPFLHGHSEGARQAARGEIETLPSGSLRVRVYGGIDPVTGTRHYLTEIIPPGPRAAKDAEKACTRLMSQVDEQRNPRTRATVNQMLDRHLEMLDVEETTLDSYESFVRNHIRPLIADVPLGRINGETLDSFRRARRGEVCALHWDRFDAATVRSAQSRHGLGLVRRSTATSCRSTRISTFLWRLRGPSAGAALPPAGRSGTAAAETQ